MNSTLASMPEPMLGHQSVLLPHGKVLMIGGRSPGRSAPYLPVATYDPATNTWK